MPDDCAAGRAVHVHRGVDPQLAGAVDGFFEVDQAPAVDVVHTRLAEVGGGGEQHVADLRVVEVGETLHQQCQATADVGAAMELPELNA